MNAELNSFIGKFKQLLKAGYTAHLDLDSNAGQAWVGLRLQLGNGRSKQAYQFPNKESKCSARDRRRAKRAFSRKSSSASLSNPSVVEVENSKETAADNIITTEEVVEDLSLKLSHNVNGKEVMINGFIENSDTASVTQ